MSGQGISQLHVLNPSRLRSPSSDRERSASRPSPAPLPAIETHDEAPSPFRQVLFACRTWGISFVMHVSLIIALAMMTYSAASTEMFGLTAVDEPPVALQTLDVSMPPPVDELAVSTVLQSSPVSLDLDDLGREITLNEIEMGQMAGSSVLDEWASSLWTNLAEAGAMDPAEWEGLTADFYGIEAEGRQFVYVLDRSGSMRSHQRWELACAELLRSIQGLRPDQEFFVILFDHGMEPMMNMRGRRAELIQATRQNVNRFRTWLSQQYPRGNTMPRNSIRMALRMQPDAIFFLSDGIFDDGTLEFLRANNALPHFSQGQTGVAVHTIAFKSLEGAVMLKQIADENWGDFKYVE